MGSLVTQNAGANALAAYGGVNPWAEAARGVSDGAYLKFNGNKGDITFGSDDDDLPEKSHIIWDMSSMAFGFICWDDSKVVEELLVNVTDGKPPLEHELTDHGPYNDEDDGWREAASLGGILYSYGGDKSDESVGTKLLLKTSTGGQVRSIRKLAGQYGRVFMQHPGELPIVELSVESYMPKQKKHGRKYSLVMKIVGWISEAEAEALSAGEGGDDERDYEDEAPKQTTSRRAAPVEEAEEEQPTPRRRAAAPAEDEDDDTAPAPVGRSARRRPAPAEQVEEAEEEAPAPRRRAAAPAEAEEEDDVAPAPRRRSAPVEQAEEEDEAPAPRRRRAAPAEDAEEEAPAPRSNRGAPANARLRRFE